MQTGKKEPRPINHDKPRRMAVIFLLLQLLFPTLTAVTVAVASGGVLDFVGRWCHESTQGATSLPLILETSSGAETRDAAPAQLIQALSFRCQDHWMLEKRHFYRKPGAICFPTFS